MKVLACFEAIGFSIIKINNKVCAYISNKHTLLSGLLVIRYNQLFVIEAAVKNLWNVFEAVLWLA